MTTSIINSLRRSGFTVSRRKISYNTLTGNIIEEDRITAANASGLVKITISRKTKETQYKLSILMLDKEARESAAEELARLGGIIDYEPGDRLLAVFKRVDESLLEEIINEVLG